MRLSAQKRAASLSSSLSPPPLFAVTLTSLSNAGHTGRRAKRMEQSVFFSSCNTAKRANPQITAPISILILPRWNWHTQPIPLFLFIPSCWETPHLPRQDSWWLVTGPRNNVIIGSLQGPEKVQALKIGRSDYCPPLVSIRISFHGWN